MYENKRFRQKWSEYTCSSGLKLVMIHKPQFVTSGAMMITPYGSLDYIQQDEDGTVYETPAGTAHFLEHKLFESESGDVMKEFSLLGANVNAFTSYESTACFFTTGEKEIEKPLHLLLDFVQTFSVSEAAVEKEKPIILEEYAMYQEDPESRLFIESMRGLYRAHPLREDIVGNEESIRRITAADLENAYRRNYHPSRMTLLIVSPLPARQLIDIVESNQSKKQFPSPLSISRKDWREDTGVVKEMSEVAMDVTSEKSCISFKLPMLYSTPREQSSMEWSMRFVLESWFSPLNPRYQSWIDEHRITPYFGYDIDCSPDHAFVQFQDEHSDCERLLGFIREETDRLRKEGIGEDQIMQLKRRTVGGNIRLFDYPAELLSSWARSVIGGISIFDEIELIEAMTSHSCMDVFRTADFGTPACAKLVSKA